MRNKCYSSCNSGMNIFIFILQDLNLSGSPLVPMSMVDYIGWGDLATMREGTLLRQRREAGDGREGGAADDYTGS